MEEKYFSYWQKKLGLTDWTIRSMYNVEPEDMLVNARRDYKIEEEN